MILQVSDLRIAQASEPVVTPGEHECTFRRYLSKLRQRMDCIYLSGIVEYIPCILVFITNDISATDLIAGSMTVLDGRLSMGPCYAMTPSVRLSLKSYRLNFKFGGNI